MCYGWSSMPLLLESFFSKNVLDECQRMIYSEFTLLFRVYQTKFIIIPSIV